MTNTTILMLYCSKTVGGEFVVQKQFKYSFNCLLKKSTHTSERTHSISITKKNRPVYCKN